MNLLFLSKVILPSKKLFNFRYNYKILLSYLLSYNWHNYEIIIDYYYYYCCCCYYYYYQKVIIIIIVVIIIIIIIIINIIIITMKRLLLLFKVLTGIGSFFTVSLGGLLIGIIFGMAACLLTRVTSHVRGK